ncbi:g6399 [Coccomyxa elongata]
MLRNSLEFCGFALPATKKMLWTTASRRLPASGPLRLRGGAKYSREIFKDEGVLVSIDNAQDDTFTVVTISGYNRPGLLTSISGTFRDLGLDVGKAEVDGSNGRVLDKFFVTAVGGGKVTDPKDIDKLRASLERLVSPAGRSLARVSSGKRPVVGDGVVESAPQNKTLLYNLMDTYIKNDVLSIEESIVNHVEYTLARSRYSFDNQEAYQATALSLRDRLIESWNDTQQYFKDVDAKRVYYLSMEFLMGRSLLNALNNLGVVDQYTEALREMGYQLEDLIQKERDAALGNGGLGRLAACFLDSMATLSLPAWGYGIRYQYGMFRQTIVDGFQHEQPDYWLNFGNPWEIERLNVGYPVNFYGHVSVHEEEGRQVFRWNPGESVAAIAYDNPIPGFQTNNTINLRLWAAKPGQEFDLEAFNTGDYVQAILSRQRAETLSSVLYPDDRTYQGKELRLKQQNFFVSATIQDVVRRYKDTHDSFDQFPDKVAFQLNDTHPTIAVPELMRVLMDENKMGWTKAWDITTKVFAFTNHTVLPEALEKWPVSLLEKLLPRHMQIIFDINWRFLQQLRAQLGDDWERIGRMSIIEDGSGGEKYVRMAYLAVVASHTVNGVAAIHSDIIKETIFKDFADLWPGKFQNKTNGVTPRRWLAFCNPPLRKLITDTLGNEHWINHLDSLQGLRQYADDPEFQQKWADVKGIAKAKALAHIREITGVQISDHVMLDIQVKRIHEYKRQLLNVLGIIWRYDQIKKMTPDQRAQVVPRACVIGGKAAPGYEMAKRIIKLISAVGNKINSDPDIGDLLKLVFVPDYNVSLAEVIIPGCELSQHISTAGTEASGTSNMKFAMNGSLIIGTMDGANVEIAEEIGEDNMFIFGVRAPEVARLRQERRNFKPDSRFEHVVGLIRKGVFGWADFFEPLVDSVTSGGDYYLLANDFPSYIDAQAKVDEVYKDKARWTRMSIMSTAGSGMFSSDRTIQQYAEQIWRVEPCQVPAAEDEQD